MATESQAQPQTKTRKPRRFGEVLIQKLIEDDEAGSESFIDFAGPFATKEAAMKSLKSGENSGKFRVIQVKGVYSLTAQTTMKLKQEG